ncbi:phage N-6-adenine-methyltransferase [Algicola sagamiensis]|uniref:phage N-6-adenine-methyltransferase n=1 Tax=Algicola sagamiensis TaxID=163869 RepID=UPI0003674100|nr:phage N-6-adenine-methyltransferase [Algicola sagamiensis]
MSLSHQSKTEPSIRDLWETPPWLFVALDEIYGPFQLDAAASDKNKKCHRFLSEKDNALSIDWFALLDSDGHQDKKVWVNPPYSNIQPWVDKAKEQQAKGVFTVMLVPDTASVGWWPQSGVNVLRITKGRISFINAESKKRVHGNTQGSALFLFDPWLAPTSKPHTVQIERGLLEAIANDIMEENDEQAA